MSDAVGALLRGPKTGGLTKSENARRVRAVKEFEKANHRTLEFIDKADEALDKEKERQQRRREADEEDRTKRRESDHWVREQHELRKNIAAVVEAEERITECQDKSKARGVLLKLTVVCVSAMLVFALIAVLQENPWYVGGSAVSLLLPAGGVLWFRSGQSKKGREADEEDAEEPKPLAWSAPVSLDPLPDEKG